MHVQQLLRFFQSLKFKFEPFTMRDESQSVAADLYSDVPIITGMVVKVQAEKNLIYT